VSTSADVSNEYVKKKVIDYYNATQDGYNEIYSPLHHGMHYGYWENNIKSHEDSLARLDQLCAEIAGIKRGELVLDAGCGVGGSSIWLAKNIGARVIGITLVPKQIEFANRFAREKKVENLTDFRIMDFTNTSFADQTFDVVWAIESICHSPDQHLFLAEAYRILKRGGRLLISDYYLNKEYALNDLDKKTLRSWLDATAVPDIPSSKELKSYLVDQRFQDIRFFDITENSLPSARIIYEMGKQSLEQTAKSHSADLDGPIIKEDDMGMVLQLELFEKGVVSKGIFLGKKA
jgi:cyclopropane fatty-acyl-phospholipid synthase-like methyltransferase